MGSVDLTGEARTIVVGLEDGVLSVTLNRPEAINALDLTMMQELRELWADLPTATRCIVITGAGKGFCAGADMSLLESDRSDAAITVADELTFLPGDQVEVPVIAAINGACAGGGLHFVADADIVIAGERATFIDPHVSVGQVTALEPLTLRLQMRPDVLTRMALLGRHERLSAGEALAAGLVSEVVADDALLRRADELARLVAANSPAATARSRKVIRDFERFLIGEQLEAGWAEIRAHWSHPDSKEGPTAFIERREPRWEEEG
jgi:enoyl-CoA hydratase/carnithine racemase